MEALDFVGSGRHLEAHAWDLQTNIIFKERGRILNGCDTVLDVKACETCLWVTKIKAKAVSSSSGLA